MHIKSPFTFGKIVEANDFCNRSEEIKNITDLVLNKNHVWIHGPRRYGKSSLVKELFRNLRKANIAIVSSIDCLLTRNQQELIDVILYNVIKDFYEQLPPLSKVKKTIQNVIKSLKPQITFDNSGEFGFGFGYNEVKYPHVENFFEALDIINTLSLHFKKPCIIAIDEFQNVLYLENYERILEIFANSAQKTSNISFIYTGSSQNQVFEILNKSYMQYSYIYHLDGISNNEFSKFIVKKFEDSKVNFNLQIINKILTLCMGNSYYVQMLCDNYWRKCFNNEIADIEDIITEIINWNQILFSEKINSLNKSQLYTLFAFRNNENHEGLSNRSLNTLINKDILFKNVDGTYRFNDPLFKYWLKYNYAQHRV